MREARLLIADLKKLKLDSREEIIDFERFACPYPDCRGMIRDESCLICERPACVKCWSIIKPEDIERKFFMKVHRCKTEQLESVKTIKKECKSCPKCGKAIYRSEGCYMMYCISCRTPFDWNTGKIITDLTWYHNPEMKRINREDFINWTDLGMFAKRYAEKLPEWKQFANLSGSVRTEIHTRETLIQKGNIDLRVLYVLNMISKEDFIVKIYQRQRAIDIFKKEIGIFKAYHSRAQEILEILHTMEMDYQGLVDAIDKYKEIVREMNREYYRETEKLVVLPYRWVVDSGNSDLDYFLDNYDE